VPETISIESTNEIIVEDDTYDEFRIITVFPWTGTSHIYNIHYRIFTANAKLRQT
jgi:hypothetical protein